MYSTELCSGHWTFFEYIFRNCFIFLEKQTSVSGDRMATTRRHMNNYDVLLDRRANKVNVFKKQSNSNLI
jgi:hypothetical protein